MSCGGGDAQGVVCLRASTIIRTTTTTTSTAAAFVTGPHQRPKTLVSRKLETHVPKTKTLILHPTSPFKNSLDTMSSASQRQRAIRGKSCIVCYQRKVRCDGQRPCATCVKTGKAPECKDSPTREIVSAKATAEMMKRLKRYEQLLIAHNIPLNEKDDSEEVLAKDHGSNGGGKMIFQSGHPRFVERSVLSV